MNKVYQVLLDNSFGQLISVVERTEKDIYEVNVRSEDAYEIVYFGGKDILCPKNTNDERLWLIFSSDNLIEAGILAMRYWERKSR